MTLVKRAFRFYSLPLYIMIHPFEGFYAMKFERRGTIRLALFNFFLVCISYAINHQYTSIIVNTQNPMTLNSLAHISTLFAGLMLFCVSNWSVTSLTDGEGRFKDILMAVCYAMTPLILTIIPATIISNFLSLEETGFYHMLLTVGMAYFVFLVFIGLVVVHNYGAVKSIITILLTFVAVLVIVFLVTLLLTLWQQMFVFLYSLYTELMFR